MSETLYLTVDKYRSCQNNAIYFRNETIKYPTFLNRVDEMADKLYSLGIKKETVVSLLAPNAPECIIALYALSKIGATISIVHPLIPKDDLKELLRETKAEHILLFDILADKYLDILKERKISIHYLSIHDDVSSLTYLGFKFLYRKALKNIDPTLYIYKMKRPKVSFEIDDDDTRGSIYLQSGGTTGKSKTVIVSQKAINFITKQSEKMLCHCPYGLSIIGVLPIFHGYGLVMSVHAPLSNGAATCLLLNFDTKEIVKKIKENKINILLGIPYMINKLMKEKGFDSDILQNLISTFVGADKPDANLTADFDAMMIKHHSINRLLQGYGLTETLSVNVVNTLKNNKPNSVGKPIDDVIVRVVDPEDFKVERKANEKGLILISSPSLCLGYMNTKEDKQPFYYLDGQKYLVTGDIGYLDEDGYLFFVNRNNDVHKIAGYNIFPSEIEKKAEACKGVITSAAIFISDKDHPYFALFIEKDINQKDDVLKERIEKHLDEVLFRYAKPEKIIIKAKLPRTNIGKIDRQKLADEIRR